MTDQNNAADGDSYAAATTTATAEAMLLMSDQDEDDTDQGLVYKQEEDDDDETSAEVDFTAPLVPEEEAAAAAVDEPTASAADTQQPLRRRREHLGQLREIPSLQILCLRAVGSFHCLPEVTFALTPDGEPSSACRLLRSFHRRPVVGPHGSLAAIVPIDNDVNGLDCIPLRRIPTIGPYSARRAHANDVDLHHPVIATRFTENDELSVTRHAPLVQAHACPALDVLQSIINALTELGRMSDARLGRNFFTEYREQLLLMSSSEPTASSRVAKRARLTPTSDVSSSTFPRGSLSLFHGVLGGATLGALVASGLPQYLAILDLTGVQSLTDAGLRSVLLAAPHLQNVSVKNCRRLTGLTVDTLASHQVELKSLDVGGAFNITPRQLLDALKPNNNTAGLPRLVALHASGLGWTDEQVDELVDTRPWEALSLNFSLHWRQPASIRTSLLRLADTIQALSLAFCEAVDNAWLGTLGRHLPLVHSLDLRGNALVNTVSGWYDGRASANLPLAAPLTVLGRYTGLTAASVEETRRVHPVAAAEALLLVILEANGGMGVAVVRGEATA
jgi:hypothetical protein